jgi:hypothetical protein
VVVVDVLVEVVVEVEVLVVVLVDVLLVVVLVLSPDEHATRKMPVIRNAALLLTLFICSPS